MLKQKILILCAILFLISYTEVRSQDKEIFTLEESVKMVLDQNPDIRIAEKELKKASAGVGVAYSNI
ncbi:MAG: hypothetical protein P8Y99_00965, partial [Calditrichaceae bacterium]